MKTHSGEQLHKTVDALAAAAAESYPVLPFEMDLDQAAVHFLYKEKLTGREPQG